MSFSKLIAYYINKYVYSLKIKPKRQNNYQQFAFIIFITGIFRA